MGQRNYKIIFLDSCITKFKLNITLFHYLYFNLRTNTMKNLSLFIIMFLLFTINSFTQDYLKMSKKELRNEHKEKLLLIDSLKSKNQNNEIKLNDLSNNLMLKNDSLISSKLENIRLNEELNKLNMKIDDLIYKDSIQNFTINLLNIKTDSLVSYLNVMKELNSNIVANDSLNSITIENLKRERDSVIEKLNKINITLNEKRNKIVDINTMTDVTFLQQERCTREVFYDNPRYEFNRNYFENGKGFILSEFEYYSVIDYVLYDEIDDIYKIYLTGEWISDGLNGYGEPSLIILSKRNGKFYFNDDGPWIACSNVEFVID